jgi:hypothetical protein
VKPAPPLATVFNLPHFQRACSAIRYTDLASERTPAALVHIHTGIRGGITECTEMTMTLQQRRSDSVRMQWNPAPSASSVSSTVHNTDSNADSNAHADVNADVVAAADCARNIDLAPLDIRTFVLTFA